jgi:molybdate transport system regulatory protein
MPTIGPLKLKVQLFCGDVIAMGPGKADLLDAIDRTGSISAAGRDLGMSYRRAWVLADEMNRCWADRLIDTRAGGGERSGARLTPLGRQVLDAYRALEAAMLTTSDGPSLDVLRTMLRPEPAPGAGAGAT